MVGSGYMELLVSVNLNDDRRAVFLIYIKILGIILSLVSVLKVVEGLAYRGLWEDWRLGCESLFKCFTGLF